MTEPTNTNETTVIARSIVDDPIRPARERDVRPLLQHHAGLPLLWTASLVLAPSVLAPILDRIHQAAFADAAVIARTVAPTWPSDGVPTMWPNWVATLASVLSALLVVTAVARIKVPRGLVLAGAVVLAVLLLPAAVSTFDLVNGKHWISLPAEVMCVAAFLFSLRSVARWKSVRVMSKGSAVTRTVVALVLSGIVLVAGAAIIVHVEQEHGVASTLVGY